MPRKKKVQITVTAVSIKETTVISTQQGGSIEIPNDSYSTPIRPGDVLTMALTTKAATDFQEGKTVRGEIESDVTSKPTATPRKTDGR